MKTKRSWTGVITIILMILAVKLFEYGLELFLFALIALAVMFHKPTHHGDEYLGE